MFTGGETNRNHTSTTDQSPVSLFYPLGLTYFSARESTANHHRKKYLPSYVRVYGLTPDTVRLDHRRRSPAMPTTHDPSRIVMRNISLHVPGTFNLYTIVMRNDETTNVEQVQNMIARFVIDWHATRCVRRSFQRDNVYGLAISNSSTGSISGNSRNNSNNSSTGMTGRLKSTTNKRPVPTSGRASCEQTSSSLSSSLELVLENLTVTVGSMYELIDGL